MTTFYLWHFWLMGLIIHYSLSLPKKYVLQFFKLYYTYLACGIIVVDSLYSELFLWYRNYPPITIISRRKHKKERQFMCMCEWEYTMNSIERRREKARRRHNTPMYHVWTKQLWMMKWLIQFSQFWIKNNDDCIWRYLQTYYWIVYV